MTRKPTAKDEADYQEMIAFMGRKADERHEEQLGSPNPLADALIEACIHGQTGKVRILLEKGADPDVIRSSGTAAGSAVRTVNAIAILELLIQAGASLNVQCRNGWSPLFIAAGEGSHQIVSFLLKAGSDVNQVCPSNGWTALMNAACAGSARTVVELLAHGADPGIRSIDGRSALDLARGNGHQSVVLVFEQYSRIASKR